MSVFLDVNCSMSMLVFALSRDSHSRHSINGGGMVTCEEPGGSAQCVRPSAEVMCIRTPDRADPKDGTFFQKNNKKIKNRNLLSRSLSLRCKTCNPPRKHLPNLKSFLAAWDADFFVPFWLRYYCHLRLQTSRNSSVTHPALIVDSI